MPNGPALLVDLRNVLYRAVCAVRSDQHSHKDHFVVALLRQMVTWMRRYKPQSVHIFWDAPRSTIWRRLIAPNYKVRDDSAYVTDLAADLATASTVARELFEHLNVRQYERPQMEADDLIYAAATVMHPKPTVIVSTDSDMLQIPYMISSCTVYDPKKAIEVPLPPHNPAMLKAIMGDETDSVKGYYGIGPKKGSAILEDVVAMQEFFSLKGAEIFHRNLLIIDLSLCPRLMANKIHVLRKLAEPVSFSRERILSLANQHKVSGLLSEYANLVPPFKVLASDAINDSQTAVTS